MTLPYPRQSHPVVRSLPPPLLHCCCFFCDAPATPFSLWRRPVLKSIWDSSTRARTKTHTYTHARVSCVEPQGRCPRRPPSINAQLPPLPLPPTHRAQCGTLPWTATAALLWVVVEVASAPAGLVLYGDTCDWALSGQCSRHGMRWINGCHEHTHPKCLAVVYYGD